MPGPNSAPNGDAELVSSEKEYGCEHCFVILPGGKGIKHWIKMSKREHERKHRRLFTGKTLDKYS